MITWVQSDSQISNTRLKQPNTRTNDICSRIIVYSKHEYISFKALGYFTVLCKRYTFGTIIIHYPPHSPSTKCIMFTIVFPLEYIVQLTPIQTASKKSSATIPSLIWSYFLDSTFFRATIVHSTGYANVNW